MNKLSLSSVRAHYQRGGTVRELIALCRDQIKRASPNPIWIHCLSEDELKPYIERLEGHTQESLPLWGVPFAIKDNIDLAGVPTTAACPAFGYYPEVSATVVQRLVDAGAIPLGKTNLDQFATGLNGTRSPYGAVKNAFDGQYISGGSSSGSAVAVALDMVCFALGTDTAGSGRVPAAFNNLVGLKPSLGLVSTRGVVPACRSLDCVTVFANDLETASEVFSVMEGFDALDPYSKHNVDTNVPREQGVRSGPVTIGVIKAEQLEFFGDMGYERAYDAALSKLAKDSELQFVEIDFQPFLDAASLLYSGPWVAERTIACANPLQAYPEKMHPVVREIVAGGARFTAEDVFSAQYRLLELKRQCDHILASVDALLTPTAGALFTRSQLQDEPVLHNTQLGHYTNYMNLLDYAGLAIPGGFTEQGLPFGLTLVGSRCSDRGLLSIARRLSNVEFPDFKPVGDSRYMDLLVCGAHMQGLPLNWQLSERGGQFMCTVRTQGTYRLLALPGEGVKRPALVYDAESGVTIGAEIWRLPIASVGSFLRDIPAPLGLGSVFVEDGRRVTGFIAAEGAVDGESRDVSEFGDWRAYLRSLSG
jgi:allophanate hydrolase